MSPVISGINRVNPLLTWHIAYLLSGMIHQVETAYHPCVHLRNKHVPCVPGDVLSVSGWLPQNYCNISRMSVMPKSCQNHAQVWVLDESTFEDKFDISYFLRNPSYNWLNAYILDPSGNNMAIWKSWIHSYKKKHQRSSKLKNHTDLLFSKCSA